MHESFINSLLLCSLLICSSVLLLSCSKSDDQRQFENEAWTTPENITKTDSHGNIEQTDPDDWRISPVYSGLIRVDNPAYPNPTPYNSSNLKIELYVTSLQFFEFTNSIEVYAFKFPDDSNIYNPIDIIQDLSSSSSLFSINLSGQLIANSSGGGNSSGIYRILIFDEGRRNLITYGDIEIGL